MSTDPSPLEIERPPRRGKLILLGSWIIFGGMAILGAVLLLIGLDDQKPAPGIVGGLMLLLAALLLFVITRAHFRKEYDERA